MRICLCARRPIKQWPLTPNCFGRIVRKSCKSGALGARTVALVIQLVCVITNREWRTPCGIIDQFVMRPRYFRSGASSVIQGRYSETLRYICHVRILGVSILFQL